MATYNLTGPQREIVTSWLYEAGGYLDVAVNSLGMSARQALAATPTLDVTTWIRTGIKGTTTGQSDWDECGLVWWIRSREGVNITNPTKPPEAAAWVTILQGWAASIDAALANVSEAIRNQSSQPITAVDGTVTSMSAGSHLTQQRLFVDNVIAVLD